MKTLSIKAQQILKFESQLTQLVSLKSVLCHTTLHIEFCWIRCTKKCKVQTDFRSLIIFVLIFILFFKTLFSFYSILVPKLIFVIVFFLVNENITELYLLDVQRSRFIIAYFCILPSSLRKFCALC